MTYKEVYNIVGYFTPKVMPEFTEEGVGHFPEGEDAIAVAKALLKQAEFWQGHNTENAEALAAAGLAVLKAAGLSLH